MAVSVLNTTSNLSGKTLVVAENAQTITGLQSFSRGANPPFSVNGGAAAVANLDADKLDGVEGASFLRSDAADTKDTGNLTLNDNIKLIFGTGGDAELYYDGTDLILDTDVVGTGVLSLTSGQLRFPGTQNASTNVNTLDDYEEGSWTPVIGGSGGTSGQTYTTQVGKYVKVGKLVTAYGYALLSAKGTITGNVQIQGLPFTSENTASLFASATIGQANNLAVSYVQINGYMVANTTAITITGRTAAATGPTTLATADIGNTTDFMFSVTYAATA